MLQRVIETRAAGDRAFDARSRRVLQANQTAAEFFVRELEELAGRTPAELAAPSKAALLEQWFGAADAAAEVQHHELREEVGERLEAPRVWDLRVVPLEAAAEDEGSQLLVASDVTESAPPSRRGCCRRAAIAQREVLVREVHHRIKANNCRAWPACCSRTPSATPRWRCR
ncbi:MAG: PAS domain-containing protein [Rubrivivax sp.]